MNNVIILASGYIKSGKDAVGNYLCKNYNFKRYAFADILKDEVALEYKIERNLLDTQHGKETKFLLNNKLVTVREILISHGLGKRNIDINYWVNKLFNKIKNEKNTNIIITDWRFENEYYILKDLLDESNKLLTLRISRFDKSSINNITETSLDFFNFDIYLDNKGTIDDLHNKLDLLIYKTSCIKKVLLDIDGVLLDWFSSFKKFIIDEYKYNLTTEFPTYWNMENWLVDDNLSPISTDEINKLIYNFNCSSAFSSLNKFKNTEDILKSIKNMGYIIITVSSCCNEEIVIENRIKNLNFHFDELIDKLICLPLNGSKSKILSQISKSIYVDDNIKNCIDGSNNHITFLLVNQINKDDLELHNINTIEDLSDILNFL